ncbi:MAG TPA: HTH domain-containing protein [Haliangiales bacterium]|nr:HTH domain-containing protein [Haliangiales bacterium]
MSTLNVVEEVLREARDPIVVKEIVRLAGGRLPTRSKTPDTVVARDLAMDIIKRGEESKFARVSPGKYTLRELVTAVPPPMAERAPEATAAS